ncbi:tetratricopeptide repeat protein [Patescibacteria group bacterium]|nr:tetratricopeptide repeat protein [Patescibacteria group bacterium]
MKRKNKRNFPHIRLPSYKTLHFSRWSRNRKVFFIFALLVVLFYGNTLFNGFVHDDIGQVENNEYVHSLQYLPKVITGCIWEFELGDCITYYRPIQSFSYLVTWQILSQPWMFHLVNLVYFTIAAFLVFVLANLLTKDSLLSFIAALLFLIHPINNEAVNWVSAVPELTFTIFMLASLIAYLSYRQMPKDSQRARRRIFRLKELRNFKLLPSLKKHKRLVLAAVLYFLAMVSKEPAVLLPLLFLFFDIFWLKTPLKKFFTVRHVARYGLFFGTFLLYLVMRMRVLGGFGQAGDYYGVFSAGERIFAFVTLFAQYMSKLVFPFPFLFFYPFEKSTAFTSLQFFLSFFLLVAFGGALFLTWKKKKVLITLSLFWILLFLLPVLLFVERVGENIFSERYLFASSIGFALLLSSGFVYLLRSRIQRIRVFGVVLLGVLLLGSWVTTASRNSVWRDDFLLYETTIQQNPDAFAIRRNLAVELTAAGRYEEAIVELEAVLQRNSEWRDISKVYNNLGDAYRSAGDFDTAFLYYEKFAEVSDENNFKPYNNLGALYFERGEYLNSLVFACKATELNPGAQEPQFNLRRLVLLFDSVQEDNLDLLHQDIVNGEVFQKSDETRIVNTGLSCNTDRCLFAFASGFQPGEVLFPFLIFGSTETGQIIRGQNPSFDAQTGAIILATSPQYETEPLTFIFPTCEGIYYEATTTTL